ncbi:MAG: hypothetical protein MZV64_24325 [Ignavibacteriales bacterium]|nr:hypothetical protein [Ignavibacteriales bacterium]
MDLRLPRVDGIDVLKAIKESDELKPHPCGINDFRSREGRGAGILQPCQQLSVSSRWGLKNSKS